MTHALPFGTFLLRLVVATGLGIVIGYERELRHRPAGLHTTGLVAAGAAVFAGIQPALGGAADRVVANIVTGVGFLAGGVILREGANISGLNTAATIWSTAAVGALAGTGLFREAFSATVAILAINLLAEPVVNALNASREKMKSKRSPE
jgi:putative Mg2+ transporter-C (MgtC) family protein